MDFRKVFCHYHTTQYITNYCSQKDCNLPLCPNCIASHTQFHIKNHTHPKYQSISQSLTRAQQTIDLQTSSFYDCKTKLVVNLVCKKQALIQNVIIGIKQTQRSVLNHIENLFQNLIKDNIAAINNRQMSAGIYSNQRLHELYDAMNIQFDYLNQVKQKLRGQNHITHMINYFEKQCDSKSKILRDISKSIQFNQQYHVQIDVDKNIFKQIQLLIKNKIQLKFTLPSKQNLNNLFLRTNSLSKQTYSLVNPFQTTLIKRKSQQNIQQRKSFNSTQQSFQRNSLENSNKVNNGLYQTNPIIYRPSSSHNKLMTMPNTQSIILKRQIISPPKKVNKLIVFENNENKQIQNKQKRGLTLHKTINEITFR